MRTRKGRNSNHDELSRTMEIKCRTGSTYLGTGSCATADSRFALQNKGFGVFWARCGPQPEKANASGSASGWRFECQKPRRKGNLRILPGSLGRIARSRIALPRTARQGVFGVRPKLLATLFKLQRAPSAPIPAPSRTTALDSTGSESPSCSDSQEPLAWRLFACCLRCRWASVWAVMLAMAGV